MGADEENLERLAESVSDGAAVDWKEADTPGAGGQERVLLRNLRVISEIARFHRDRPAAGEPLVSSRVGTISTPGPGTGAGRIAEEAPAAWGHLEIRARLGGGAYGEVYRAWDTRLDREVALKLLRRLEPEGDTLASSVIKEGRLLARVRHPNVVTVYGAERHDDRVGIWMELIDGRTLEDLLRSQGPFGEREAALIGLSLCSALAAVHRAGLVHRDIKTHNVMREQGGRIVLMDFSAGGEVRGDEARAGSALTGTPLYMAPEILQGREATVRADIYSLGVLLYHLVSGSYPVEARTWSDLRQAHEHRGAKLLRDARPGLPEGFLRAVERALAPAPEDRFSSAGEMEQALARAIGTEAPQPVPAIKEPVRKGVHLHLKWGPMEITVGAGLVVAAIASLVLWRSQIWIGNPPLDASEPPQTPPIVSTAPGGTTPDAEREPAPSRSGGAGRAFETMSNLAALHQAMGDYARAGELYGKVLATQRSALPEDDTAIADTLVRLAWVQQASGDNAAAKAAYKRALEIYEKRLGPEHPDFAATLAGLISFYQKLGLDKEARPLMEQASALRPGPPAPRPPEPSGPVPDRPADVASLGTLGARVKASAGPYDVEATLYRRTGGRDERLVPGSRVGPGDELLLEFRASESLYVYVLNEDENGETYVLFPIADGDLNNPLPPGGPHRLPGRLPRPSPVAGGPAQLLWKVTSVGRSEHILVVASPERLTEFENELQSLAKAAPGTEVRYARLSDATAKRLRGIGGVVARPDPAAPGPPSRIFERARQLADRPEQVRGVWIRQIDLENPQPN
jgi:serine/threonine-protein kinase